MRIEEMLLKVKEYHRYKYTEIIGDQYPTNGGF